MRKKYLEEGKHLDEVPKNNIPKHISKYIRNMKVKWLQEPGTFGGHKIHKDGHRMVSGIVRAKKKREFKQDLENID